MSGNGSSAHVDVDRALALSRHPSAVTRQEPEHDQPVSLVLFSGTDDRLEAATVLMAGAAAMGRPVNGLLQYWALEAFTRGRMEADHGLSPEASLEGANRIRLKKVHQGYQHWSETLRQVKEIGEITIRACALSMDTFGLDQSDLDPMVEGVEGVASFMSRATGPITFI